ncbi:MAG: C39 family peptidase [Candidatus Omnitrophica bacterium]|nr:C39 family peptidase [Candidatus Omnitrophota bacterium]
MIKKLIITLAVFVIPLSASAEHVAFSTGIAGMSLSKPVKSLREIRNQNVVRQRVDIGCGPASLATILSYHFDDQTSEHDIIKFLVVEENYLEEIKKKGGFSLLDLKRYALSKDYQAGGYRVDIKELSQLEQPAIVLLNIEKFPHFMVLKGVQGNTAYLADPSWGNITMDLTTFSNLWQGILLVVNKENTQSSNLLQISSKDLVIPDAGDIKRNLGSGMIHFVANPLEF